MYLLPERAQDMAELLGLLVLKALAMLLEDLVREELELLLEALARVLEERFLLLEAALGFGEPRADFGELHAHGLGFRATHGTLFARQPELFGQLGVLAAQAHRVRRWPLRA